MPPPLLLCAVADDESAGEVVATGRRLAQAGGYALRFAHVAQPPLALSGAYGPFPGVGGAAMVPPHEELERMIEVARRDGIALLDGLGVPEEQGLVAVGEPVEVLERLADEHHASLVVVGTRGRGVVAAALLGSVSQTLAREGSQPVVVASPVVDDAPPGPVVCGVDPDLEQARTAVANAAALATRLDRTLVLARAVSTQDTAAVTAGVGPVPVVEPVPAGELDAAREELVRLAERLTGVQTEVSVLQGLPAPALHALAEDRAAELLVVAWRGAGAVRTMLEGSVSLDLIRRASCPVVVVGPRAS